jgi:acyl carrier protein
MTKLAAGEAAMRTEDDILEQIKTILSRYNPEDKPLLPETELISELNIDSVAAMNVIMEIEDLFDIDIPVNEVAELRRVKDLVAMVEKQSTGG